MRRYTVLVSFDAASDSDAAVAITDLRNAAEDLTSWDFNVREFTLKDEGTAPDDDEPEQTYLTISEPNEHVDHFTVAGSVTQLLNHRVSEAARNELVQRHESDSGNYIAEKILVDQQTTKGMWDGVRFESEHGTFFAYTTTRDRAQELVEYLLGLSWTTA